MKKIYGLLIALICLSISVCASAEPFALRNGILFGDSYQTVEEKETLPKVQVVDLNSFSSTPTMPPKTGNEKIDTVNSLLWLKNFSYTPPTRVPMSITVYPEHDGWYYLQFTGKIAGVSNGIVSYFFEGKTNTLVEMGYTLTSDTTKEADEHYTNIVTTLKDKYGTPLGNTNGNYYLISGETFNTNSTYRAYEEWIVPCDEGYVKVDILLNDKVINMSYHVFTQEEYDLAELLIKEQKESEQTAMDNDL